MTSHRTVEVIIPTYKPDDRFVRLLELLKRQTYPIDLVRIINTDKAEYDAFFANHKNPLVPGNCEVLHITSDEFDHAGTRKMAVTKSNSDIFVMMTQDAIPTDEYLIEKLIRPLVEESDVAVSYARQVPSPGATLAERYVRSFNYPDKSRMKSEEDIPELGIKAFFCSDVCAAYRRDIYDEIGGFIDRAIFNEDMIYACNAIRHGYRVSYTAEARVIHSHNYSAMQQFHRNFDLAVSQVDHPEVFEGLPSEGEGMKLVKGCISYMLNQKKPWLIPGFVINCAGRLSGFKLGKMYKRLPKQVVMWATSNPKYWKEYN